MSFFDQLGQGLAIVQQEAAKHINSENINRASGEIRRHADHAAQRIQQVQQVFILSSHRYRIFN
jgi:hypothetical protein